MVVHDDLSLNQLLKYLSIIGGIQQNMNQGDGLKSRKYFGWILGINFRERVIK